jgi:hypothetical protein
MKDPAYDEEVPEVWVRCILCGETMPKDEFEIHDCDIIGWEEVNA